MNPEAFLQELVYREALRSLMNNYATALDTLDWSLHRSLIDDRIEVAMPWLEDFQQRELAGDEWSDASMSASAGFASSQHFVTNVELGEVHAGSMLGRASFFAEQHLERDGREEHLSFGGRYRLTLRQRGKSWRLSALVVEKLWHRGDLAVFRLAAERGASGHGRVVCGRAGT